jgi:hypothetical protein
VKTALGAPLASQEELLGHYNLATALDPALVALTRACPFYEGRAEGAAASTVHYRGILGSFHFFSVGLAVSAAYLVAPTRRTPWAGPRDRSRRRRRT